MIKDYLLKHIDECNQKRILVIGDVMLDEFHWCSVSRISPEAPVPICRVEKTTIVPGGAGNVARNIQSLNGRPTLSGVIGLDSSGDKFIDVLKEYNIPTSCILQNKERPTILKSRIIAHQQHVARVDREDPAPISRKIQNQLLKQFESSIGDHDLILISDYLKGTLPDNFILKIIKLAKIQGKKVVIDPKGDTYQKYVGASVLTPNFSEFKAIVKKPLETERDIHAHGLKLVRRLKLDALLVTRSEKGMTIIKQSGEKIDIPTKAKEVFDITGAGDTVIAVLSLALGAGWDIEKAAILSNYAAGIVVGKIGTSSTFLEEIKTIIRKDIPKKASV